MSDRVITLSPVDRYALVGKSRSGKTSFGVVLASCIVPYDKKAANGWEVWWVDTKNDKRDIDRLHRWGFTDGYKGKTPRKIIMVPFEKGKPTATVEAVNDICYRALEQHGVVLVIDEYRHCVPTTRTASPGILHVHQRGAGRDVGLIGMTQEPCDIPRQLISQASHAFLFNLTYPYDIKYARSMYPLYQPAKDRAGGLEKNSHGFYHSWLDGDGEYDYYPHQGAWHAKFATPVTV